ncbi:hypothetical protein V8C40DRAFT_249656 [Trichoderma camerunense]
MNKEEGKWKKRGKKKLAARSSLGHSPLPPPFVFLDPSRVSSRRGSAVGNQCFSASRFALQINRISRPNARSPSGSLAAKLVISSMQMRAIRPRPLLITYRTGHACLPAVLISQPGQRGPFPMYCEAAPAKREEACLLPPHAIGNFFNVGPLILLLHGQRRIWPAVLSMGLFSLSASPLPFAFDPSFGPWPVLLSACETIRVMELDAKLIPKRLNSFFCLSGRMLPSASVFRW